MGTRSKVLVDISLTHVIKYGSTSYDNAKQQKRSNSVSGDSGWDGDNWLEATTKDGRIYFYHRKTRKVRWDKPPPHIARQMDERKRQEEMLAEKRRKERVDALRRAQEDKKEYNAHKLRLSNDVQKRVHKWSHRGPNGLQAKTLYELLDTIHTAMPNLIPKALPGSGHLEWHSINEDSDPFGLHSTPRRVDMKVLKKMYRVALLKVHPDRIGKDASLEDRLLAEQVFDVINKQAKASGL